MVDSGDLGHRVKWVGLVLLVVVAGPGLARADQGAALDIGNITVDTPLEAGTGYDLPAMGVSNPGTDGTTYRMSVRGIAGQGEQPLDPDWFVFQPTEFHLDPGETQLVSVGLLVPFDAVPGSYAGLVGPDMVSQESGVAVAGGAASKLAFRVVPATEEGAADQILSVDPWVVMIIAGGFLVMALVRGVTRRFAIRIERR